MRMGRTRARRAFYPLARSRCFEERGRLRAGGTSSPRATGSAATAPSRRRRQCTWRKPAVRRSPTAPARGPAPTCFGPWLSSPSVTRIPSSRGALQHRGQSDRPGPVPCAPASCSRRASAPFASTAWSARSTAGQLSRSNSGFWPWIQRTRSKWPTISGRKLSTSFREFGEVAAFQFARTTERVGRGQVAVHRFIDREAGHVVHAAHHVVEWRRLAQRAHRLRPALRRDGLGLEADQHIEAAGEADRAVRTLALRSGGRCCCVSAAQRSDSSAARSSSRSLGACSDTPYTVKPAATAASSTSSRLPVAWRQNSPLCPP